MKSLDNVTYWTAQTWENSITIIPWIFLQSSFTADFVSRTLSIAFTYRKRDLLRNLVPSKWYYVTWLNLLRNRRWRQICRTAFTIKSVPVLTTSRTMRNLGSNISTRMDSMHPRFPWKRSASALNQTAPSRKQQPIPPVWNLRTPNSASSMLARREIWLQACWKQLTWVVLTTVSFLCILTVFVTQKMKFLISWSKMSDFIRKGSVNKVCIRILNNQSENKFKTENLWTFGGGGNKKEPNVIFHFLEATMLTSFHCTRVHDVMLIYALLCTELYIRVIYYCTDNLYIII